MYRYYKTYSKGNLFNMSFIIAPHYNILNQSFINQLIN